MLNLLTNSANIFCFNARKVSLFIKEISYLIKLTLFVAKKSSFLFTCFYTEAPYQIETQLSKGI